MQCRDCGYVMTDADRDCPNCAHFSVEASPVCKVSAREEVGIREADVMPSALPSLKLALAKAGNRLTSIPPAYWVLIVTGVLFVCMIFAAFFIHPRLTPAPETEEQHIARTLASVESTYPTAHFGLYQGDSTTISVNYDVPLAGIRDVNLSRSGTLVDATVHLVGVQPQAQAPTVYVRLLDDNGIVLGSKDVVNFTYATLENREERAVSDSIIIEENAHPAIVCVDDGGGPPDEVASAPKSVDNTSGFLNGVAAFCINVFFLIPCEVGLVIGGIILACKWGDLTDKERRQRSWSFGILFAMVVAGNVLIKVPFLWAWVAVATPFLAILFVVAAFAGWIYYLVAVTQLGAQLDRTCDDIHTIAQNSRHDGF